MPANKKDDESKAAAVEKAPKTDAQGHPVDGPDFIPDAKAYDPAKHANHSHLNP